MARIILRTFIGLAPLMKMDDASLILQIGIHHHLYFVHRVQYNIIKNKKYNIIYIHEYLEISCFI